MVMLFLVINILSAKKPLQNLTVLPTQQLVSNSYRRNGDLQLWLDLKVCKKKECVRNCARFSEIFVVFNFPGSKYEKLLVSEDDRSQE